MLKRTFILLMLTWLAQTAWTQTYVTVHLNNGSSNAYTLETSGKIDLTTENTLAIHESNLSGVTASYNTDDIRKVTFSRTNAGIDEVSLRVSVHPNPTNGKLILSGIEPNGQTAYLYTVTGKLVETYPVFQNSGLDLSRQPQGIYILKVGDSRVKIIKI